MLFDGAGDFQVNHFGGRHLHFDMIFSDYARGAIRLSALMGDSTSDRAAAGGCE